MSGRRKNLGIRDFVHTDCPSYSAAAFSVEINIQTRFTLDIWGTRNQQQQIQQSNLEPTHSFFKFSPQPIHPLTPSTNPNSPLRRHTWLPSRCWLSPPSPPASFASEGPSRRRCSWRRRTRAGPGRPWRNSPSGTCRWPWRRGSWAMSPSSGCW